MNRKALITAAVGALFASTSTFGAALLTFVKTNPANAPGRNVFTFSITNDDGLSGSYAVEFGFEGAEGSTIIQTLKQSEDENGDPIFVPVNVRSGWNTSAERNNDTWGYDAIFGTQNPGNNPFGTGDFNGAAPGDFNGYSEALKPNSFAIALGSQSGLGTGVNTVQIVATGDVTFTGAISRNGVTQPRQTGTTAVNVVGVSLVNGGTATTTVAGNGVSYIPTVVLTSPSPLTTGTVAFQFAGVNDGDTLIALDLNLGGATLAAALGTLPANITLLSGVAPFGGSYDAVLLADTTGSGPFTFTFTLGGGATLNAISVVPEPTGVAALALAAIPALRRRRA